VTFSHYFQDWVIFLTSSDAILGIPFCLAGAALVLMGWRMWRLVAFLSFALIGGSLGQMYSGESALNVEYAGAGAALFALASLAVPTLSPTFLGGIVGLIGGRMALNYIGFFGPSAGICLAILCIGAAAWAYANRHRVVVTISSLEGAILVISGLTIMIADWPFLYNFFSNMLASSGFMLAFFLLVPTVIGITLQIADSNRTSAKAATG